MPESNPGVTDIWFTIVGTNLNLRPDGSVERVIDARRMLSAYRTACAEQHGLLDPPVIVFNDGL